MTVRALKDADVKASLRKLKAHRKGAVRSAKEIERLKVLADRADRGEGLRSFDGASDQEFAIFLADLKA